MPLTVRRTHLRAAAAAAAQQGNHADAEDPEGGSANFHRRMLPASPPPRAGRRYRGNGKREPARGSGLRTLLCRPCADQVGRIEAPDRARPSSLDHAAEAMPHDCGDIRDGVVARERSGDDPAAEIDAALADPRERYRL